jgi:hypothetical protein
MPGMGERKIRKAAKEFSGRYQGERKDAPLSKPGIPVKLKSGKTILLFILVARWLG